MALVPFACPWPCPKSPGTNGLERDHWGPAGSTSSSPAAEGVLRCQRVGAALYRARNDGPELVTTLTAEASSASTSRVIMDECYALFKSEFSGP
jgi:hypothetical protein